MLEMDKVNSIVAPCRGQLKIAVYVNYGLLTVHVVQARHLSTMKREFANAYIKLAISPDESRRTKCKTEIVKHSNNPEFNEKFSFELLGDDLRKRLFITVWSKDPRSHDNGEFLGSMSFGVQHIMSMRKQVDGWYYLLNDDVGKRKHLQVATRLQTTGESEGGTGHYLAPPPMSQLPLATQTLRPEEIIFMEPHVFVIRRLGGSFGFSVMCHTYGPVFISRVESGSPAESSGLKMDDRIVRINGNNVNRAMADNVAKIIKNSEKKIILEIQRPTIRRREDPLPHVDDTCVYEQLPSHYSSAGSVVSSAPGEFDVPEPPPPSSCSEATSHQPLFLSPVKLSGSEKKLIPYHHKENLLSQTMQSERAVGLCGMIRRRKKRKGKGMAV